MASSELEASEFDAVVALFAGSKPTGGYGLSDLHWGQATSVGALRAWWARRESRREREVRFLGTGCLAILRVLLNLSL